jgi:hypothetical protein
MTKSFWDGAGTAPHRKVTELLSKSHDRSLHGRTAIGSPASRQMIDRIVGKENIEVSSKLNQREQVRLAT